jgi:surfeit locus 1 family protein
MTHRDARPSPFRTPWLWLTIAIVLLTLLFLRLAFWQIDRLGQRRAANAEIVARTALPSLTLDGASLDPEAANLRRATVKGRFDFSQEMILRNRAYNEIPGVHALTPLRISGSDAAILVDRGWIPYELQDSVRRAKFQQPVDEVEISGILRASQERVSSMAPAESPLAQGETRRDAWFRTDIPAIQPQVPYPLLGMYLEQLPADVPFAAPRLPRPDPDIALSEGSHMVYAIQWFLFAAIAAGGYVILYRQRSGSGD